MTSTYEGECIITGIGDVCQLGTEGCGSNHLVGYEHATRYPMKAIASLPVVDHDAMTSEDLKNLARRFDLHVDQWVHGVPDKSWNDIYVRSVPRLDSAPLRFPGLDSAPLRFFGPEGASRCFRDVLRDHCPAFAGCQVRVFHFVPGKGDDADRFSGERGRYEDLDAPAKQETSTFEAYVEKHIKGHALERDDWKRQAGELVAERNTWRGRTVALLDQNLKLCDELGSMRSENAQLLAENVRLFDSAISLERVSKNALVELGIALRERWLSKAKR